MSDGASNVRVVVGGVSGSGKSTVGEALAARLGVAFEDGDDLHPDANKDKMRAGEALTDEDRRPWLIAVGEWLEAREGGVVACSALRRTHRDLLRAHADDLDILMLDGEPDVIRERQAGRGQHFMPSSLMNSQFATYEPMAPEERGVTLDVSDPVDVIVESYVAGLTGRSADRS